MKMPNRAILNAVESGRTSHRPMLREPYLDVEESRVVATDGSILAVCPVELDDGDTSGYLSPEALKAAVKVSPEKARADKTLHIKASDMLVLNNGASFPRSDLGTFPPAYGRFFSNKGKAHHVVSLDAKLLKQLSDAINAPGDSRVILYFPEGKLDAIYVGAGSKSDGYGVIMPIRVK